MHGTQSHLSGILTYLLNLCTIPHETGFVKSFFDNFFPIIFEDASALLRLCFGFASAFEFGADTGLSIIHLKINNLLPDGP